MILLPLSLHMYRDKLEAFSQFTDFAEYKDAKNAICIEKKWITLFYFILGVLAFYLAYSCRKPVIMGREVPKLISGLIAFLLGWIYIVYYLFQRIRGKDHCL